MSTRGCGLTCQSNRYSGARSPTLGTIMKLVWILLAAAITGVSQAECPDGAVAASNFMNTYKTHVDDVLNRKTKETTDHWLQRNTNITQAFKKAYKKLVEEANKADPELGLDFDPIFDAQDYPNQGFAIVSCEEESAQTRFVTLKGMDWEEFVVVVKVVGTDKGGLVDGAGVINVPKKKQAHRG